MNNLENFQALTATELLDINGGKANPPHVSDNSYVQTGYEIGWHIGHAVGNTIQQAGQIIENIGDLLFP